MNYDPFYHYEEDEKKRKRWDRLLPVFVAAIVLLVGFYGFFVAYQRSHAKPAAVGVQDKKFIQYNEISNPGSHVEGKWSAEWSDWAKKNVYLAPCKEGDSKWDDNGVAECVKASPKPHKRKHYHRTYGKLTGDGGWLVKEAAVDRPKLHKRKHHQETVCMLESDGTTCNYMPKFQLVPSPYDWNWHIVSTVPSEMWCEKPKGAEAFNCMSRPLTPDEIKMYQPEPKWETGATWSRRGDEWDNGHVHLEPTTPQDIANLMEQIAPTKPHGVQMETGDYPSMTTKPAKPDCKMPADVDVCPDTIDPKAADDSDSKNKARQSLATAMLICAENPKATPAIILKDGPTPVPCATLKWAVDAVDADDKKGKP